MWGSSFADLAKKAQELQEQATSLSTGELFNLDAMHAVTGKPAEKKPTAEHNTENSQPPAKPSFSLPILGGESIVATPEASISPAPKGKLKMSAKKSPMTTAKKSPQLIAKKSPLIIAKKSPKTEEKPTTSSMPPMALPEKKNITIEAKKEPKVEGPVVAKNGIQQPAGAESEKKKDLPLQDKGTDKGQLQPTIFPASSKEAKANIDAKAPTNNVPTNNAATPIQEETRDPSGGNQSKLPEKEEVVVEQSSMQGTKEEENSNASPTIEGAATNADETTAQEQLVKNDAKTEPGEPGSVAAFEKATPDVVEKKVVATLGQQMQEERQPTGAVKPQVEAGCGDETATPEVVDKKVEETVGLQKQEEMSPVETDISRAEPEKKTSKPVMDRGDTPTEKNEPSANLQPESNVTPVDSKPQTQPDVDKKRMGPPEQASSVSSSNKHAANSDQVMQQFTAQLQRLEANFEAERKELNLQHSRNIEQTIAAKEEEMEQLRAQMKEKDSQIRELRRMKEGKELRMDSLKREVDGIKALLEERDVEIEKLKGGNKQEKVKLEQQIRALELDHGKTQTQLKAAKDELENSRGKLGTTSEEYSALKSRVKVVAGELKERRAECRELKSKIEEAEESNNKLQDHISALESQLSDRDRSGTEKDEEVNQLLSTIDQLKRQVKEKEKSIEEQEAAFEKNLGNYKKKAQNSLSVANARAAAAIQSKEEAELEARAARTMADSTMQRAKIAEANGQQAMVEAKEYYKEMEEAKLKAVRELASCRNEFETLKKSYSELKAKQEALVTEKDVLAVDNAQRARDIETERSKSSILQQDLDEARRRSNSLQENVAELRRQLQRAEATAASNDRRPSEPTADTSKAAVPTEDSNSRATIMMLQKQLQEANGTIDELKEALENAIVARETSDGANQGTGAPKAVTDTNGGNETSAPLFYAMEKQAELNTARNEINRLASLYADVQSEKNEAEEALRATRKELDGERSKLQRYEKLGPNSGTGTANGSGSTNGHQAGQDPGRTNIEYLKNIMMSYLNAKTLAERKSLVPVIGAVLCLTADEQSKAIQNIESSGGIEGFSSALFETIGSRVSR